MCSTLNKLDHRMLISSRQDLIGAACAGSQRRFSHSTFPEIAPIVDMVTISIKELPNGFLAHQDVLVDDLRDCIKCIVTLHALYESRDPGTCTFTLLDQWQASIESRLVFLADSCLQFGIVSECCRLAAYICCYSIYTEVWKNSFIPEKQAGKLLRLLSETLHHPVWTSRRDLFLWLVFVCTSSFLEVDACDQAMKNQLEELMRSLSVSVNDWTKDGCSIDKALDAFLYVDEWLQRRFSNRRWLAIEIAFRCATDQSK
jgi:hypothetical protein